MKTCTISMKTVGLEVKGSIARYTNIKITRKKGEGLWFPN